MRVRFDSFVLDDDTRQLTRDDHPVHLSTKAFDLLTALVAARPKMLTKTVLQQHLWPDTFVVEANLSNLIAEIRDALADDARAPRFVRTIHGKGYAFCGAVDVAPPAGRGARPLCWLEWSGQTVPLHAGVHVIGRDPGLAVRIDAATVSRRHAQITVSENGVLLEDFGSKNGTRVGDRLVTAAIHVADGDTLRFGTVAVVLRVGIAPFSTVTASGAAV
jgi:DNA-binding winged helix-turn-helix (wHTH) protein